MTRSNAEIEEELILLRAEMMTAMETRDFPALLRAKHRTFALNEILRLRSKSETEGPVTFEEASAFLQTWAGDKKSPTKDELCNAAYEHFEGRAYLKRTISEAIETVENRRGWGIRGPDQKGMRTIVKDDPKDKKKK